jgi:hypothetical protein
MPIRERTKRLGGRHADGILSRRQGLVRRQVALGPEAHRPRILPPLFTLSGPPIMRTKERITPDPKMSQASRSRCRTRVRRRKYRDS